MWWPTISITTCQLSVLNACELSITPPFTGLARTCTVQLARSRWPGQSAKLADVYQRLLGAPLAGQHNADADVRACDRIFFAMRDLGTDDESLAKRRT